MYPLRLGVIGLLMTISGKRWGLIAKVVLIGKLSSAISLRAKFAITWHAVLAKIWVADYGDQ